MSVKYTPTDSGRALRQSAQKAKGQRGTSLIRNSALLGPYSRTMHRALWWVLGGGRFIISEVPLYVSPKYPGHRGSNFNKN